MMRATTTLLSLLSLLVAIDGFRPVFKPAGPRALTRSVPRMAPTADGMPTEEETGVAKQKIKKLVEENKVMLFMKGNRMFPQCGFSNTAVQVLGALGVEYETFDILEDAFVRQEVKTFSNWPTIPQLYVDGEFLGGCDIMVEMFESGELKEAIEEAKA
mmetsp:Transcript_85212/g.241469  ORF Transcript_85212/g.241469 Transcript_85212/m.241469 type:complete len:158 (+) Transcript_85212:119-592(+)